MGLNFSEKKHEKNKTKHIHYVTYHHILYGDRSHNVCVFFYLFVFFHFFYSIAIRGVGLGCKYIWSEKRMTETEIVIF